MYEWIRLPLLHSWSKTGESLVLPQATSRQVSQSAAGAWVKMSPLYMDSGSGSESASPSSTAGSVSSSFSSLDSIIKSPYSGHPMDLFTLLMLRVNLCDMKFTPILVIIMGYNRYNTHSLFILSQILF